MKMRRRNSCVHPGGVRASIVRHSSLEPFSLATHISNSLVYHANCVTDGSHRTYSTGYRAFLEFCRLGGVDPSLKIKHPMFRLNTSAYNIAVIMSFMSYGASVKGWSPETIRVYVNGIRDQFRRQLFDTEVFKSIHIRDTLAGIRLDYRCVNDEAAEKQRLPFTIEMFLYMVKFVVPRSTIENRALIVCVCIGLALLCRASELLMTPDNHYLRGLDVRFHTNNSRSDEENYFPPSQAATHVLSAVTGVSINIRSAKNDQAGKGHKYYFSKRTVSDSIAFCLVTEMFQWAAFATPADLDPFLSHKGTWQLSYAAYLRTVKRVAKDCGFNPNRFGTHSIRIGGASILAAAGHPNHYIRMMGRWNSETFMRYLRSALATMEAALASLVNPRLFTNEDLL